MQQSPVGVGPDLLRGGTAVPGDLLGPLHKVCVACLNAAAGLAEQAPTPLAVEFGPVLRSGGARICLLNRGLGYRLRDKSNHLDDALL